MSEGLFVALRLRLLLWSTTKRLPTLLKLHRTVGLANVGSKGLKVFSAWQCTNHQAAPSPFHQPPTFASAWHIQLSGRPRQRVNPFAVPMRRCALNLRLQNWVSSHISMLTLLVSSQFHFYTGTLVMDGTTSDGVNGSSVEGVASLCPWFRPVGPT
jgi:hypothetical protein